MGACPLVYVCVMNIHATCYSEYKLHVCTFVPLQVLLHCSAGEESKFLSVKSSEFDQDLFLLSWGPTVAALSYVFDKADEKSIVQRAIDGFRYIHMQVYPDNLTSEMWEP